MSPVHVPAADENLSGSASDDPAAEAPPRATYRVWSVDKLKSAQTAIECVRGLVSHLTRTRKIDALYPAVHSTARPESVVQKKRRKLCESYTSQLMLLNISLNNMFEDHYAGRT